ncbi:MAG: aminoacyl-histidine dipeptidase [Candidatus Thermoplasmatota archaeon]|nr:aminoacyl-histidine dipeptidase [Candidatus Thermoplasmatota archaeon]
MSVVKDLKPRLLWKRFEEISRIPRCSKHEEKIKDYIINFAEEQKLEYKLDETGNVVIKKPADKGMEAKPIVILQGHMDMVCEKNSDVTFDFSKDSIQLVKKDDILTAKGTTLGADNGIGVAAALAILEDDSLTLGPIEALFTVDEETGLTGAFALSDDMLNGRILLNLDSEDWGVITVGCAGGGNSEITLPVSKKNVDASLIWLKANVRGLRGGHSGIDAHEQRGNAVKILTRILWKADHNTDGIALADFSGGDKHNAIPREAHAIIGVPAKNKENLERIMNKEADHILKEYKPIDPKFSFKLTDMDTQTTMLTKESKKTFLHLVHGLPHGVEKMSYDIKGLVETSTNLAKATIEDDHAFIMLSSRSSIMSALQDLRDRIHATTILAGGSVEEEEPYPGWKPDLDSNVLKLAKQIYKKKYGKDPVVEAIHAGLECGIIGEKYGGMDMISIGPTIKYPHSPEEQITISTVEPFYDFVVNILEEIK